MPYIDVAKVKDVANFTFNNLKQTGQQELSAVLAYPAEQDIDVNFQVNPSLIGYYNASTPIMQCWTLNIISFLHNMSSSPRKT